MVPAVIALMIFTVTLFINQEIEQNNSNYMSLTFRQRTGYIYRAMKQAMKMDSLRRLMIFFTIFLLIMPNFKDYLDYFYNFDVTWDASLEIVVSTGVLISTIVYANFLEEVEIRKIAGIAIGFYLLNQILNMLLVTGVINMKMWPFVSI